MAVGSLLSKIVRKKRTLKDRTRETKGKTKSKRFEEIKIAYFLKKLKVTLKVNNKWL